MPDSLAIATQVIAALSRCAIPHVVVGSFARNYYAFPRSTEHADIVLALDTASLNRFEAELGGEFSLDRQTTFETNTGTFRHVLIHRETEFKTELFLLSRDAYDQDRFSRRVPFNFNGEASFVLTAEDVIVTKLRWMRSKDVIAVNEATPDWSYIHRWTAIHDTRAKLDKIRASVPKID